MIVKNNYTLFLNEIGLNIQNNLPQDQGFNNFQNNNNNFPSNPNPIPHQDKFSIFPNEKEVMDPRQYFPAYGTGNYYQKMDYFVKDEKVPISDSEEYFIALPNNNNGFNLKVENLELNCSDCTVIITKKMIKFNQPIIFDYTNMTMRVLIPVFNENRILNKDGTSFVKGYKVYDFDNNSILVKNKVSLNSIENDLSEVTSVSISGDYGFVTFENGFFDGKDIKIKVRGLTKVGLGNSCVRSINIDSQMGTIDSSNITKL